MVKDELQSYHGLDFYTFFYHVKEMRNARFKYVNSKVVFLLWVTFPIDDILEYTKS